MFVVSCDRKPTAGDHVDRMMNAIEVYMFQSADQAEAAMLDLEKFTLECRAQGVVEISYDQHLAATYSRLYLLQKKLGKLESATNSFNLASNYWHTHYQNRGVPIPTAEEMPGEIEGVDRYFGTPVWKK
jgi:hypothetical protein